MSANCATHPATPAVETCERCGRFVCGECLNVESPKSLCTACYQRLPAEFRERPTAITIIAFVLCFVNGYAFVVLADKPLIAIAVLCLAPLLSGFEYRQSRRGKRNQATQNLSRLTLILSSVVLLLGTALTGAIAAKLFRF